MHCCLQLRPSRAAPRNSQVEALCLKYSSHHFCLHHGKSIASEVSVRYSVLWENRCQSACKREEIFISPWVFCFFFLNCGWFCLIEVFPTSDSLHLCFLFSAMKWPPPLPHCSCGWLLLILWAQPASQRSFLERKDVHSINLIVTLGVGLVFVMFILEKSPGSPHSTSSILGGLVLSHG